MIVYMNVGSVNSTQYLACGTMVVYLPLWEAIFFCCCCYFALSITAGVIGPTTRVMLYDVVHTTAHTWSLSAWCYYYYYLKELDELLS